MRDAQRYRDGAAGCLRAAQEANLVCYRQLNLAMADAWLSLGLENEAMDGLLTIWDAAEPIKRPQTIGAG